MIIDMQETTTSDVSKRLVTVREEGGVVTLGRVLTLVICTRIGEEEEAIEAANDASREHPMRIIVVSKQEDSTGTPPSPRLDAQIRVGGDAGASEVVVLRALGEIADDEAGLVNALLLPDAPVVAWWPDLAPDVVADSPLGRIATRRITDSAAQRDPATALTHLARTYHPGDTDFAWTRLTLWRTQLAAVLDQPPYEPVTHVEVTGAADSPSAVLLAAWLKMQLGATLDPDPTNPQKDGTGIHGVNLTRASGIIKLQRDRPAIATLAQPGQPTHDVALPHRSLRDCLAEELRRLDPDTLYGEVITRGIKELGMAV